MEPSNKYILPMIGLFLPLIFYFILGSFIAPFLTAINISNDILLGILGFCYLIVISWSYHEGKSQSKFFKKYPQKIENDKEIGLENTPNIPVKRFGSCFFINVFANLIAIGIWLYSDDYFVLETSSKLGVENVWYAIVVLIIFMFLCSNIFRIFSSILFFKINIGKSINSIKFIVLEEIILYGLVVLYFLFIGGFFF